MSYRDTGWTDQAACRGFIHFTDLRITEQRRTCQACTVTSECADLGLQSITTVKDALEGPIYGGLHPTELAELVKRRRRDHHKQALDGAVGTNPASTVSSMAVAGRTRGDER
jgi:hypothetical protein